MKIRENSDWGFEKLQRVGREGGHLFVYDYDYVYEDFGVRGTLTGSDPDSNCGLGRLQRELRGLTPRLEELEKALGWQEMERKPPWLRAKIPGGPEYLKVRNLVQENRLHTVCESAHCPNLGECWSRGTATIMILGDTCTRSCRFCAIATGKPGEVDWGEPARVADAVRIMGLKHAVITSVARDDLEDGGAEIWARTVRAVRNVNPETHIEVLIPDFKGKEESLNTVLDADPDILNHNMETVKRLQKPVRVQARYERSLEVLRRAKARGFVTKTGLMLGIGEKDEEIEETLQDLAEEKVDILTLGQYLRPTPKHLPIDRWVTPEEFAKWKERALALGFGVCESGPLVRSSYHADEQSAKYTTSLEIETKA